MRLIKPTKEQFEDFVLMRNSGVTNMFDVQKICELSTTGLNREICLYIMIHFSELSEEYNW